MANKRQLKKSIEIMCSYGSTINKGNYENDKDLYSLKLVQEFEGDLSTDFIKETQRMFRDLCKEMCDYDYKAIKSPEEQIITENKSEVITNDYELQKKMTWITLISSAKYENELTELGKEIAKDKNKFQPEVVDEIRNEFNKKMKEFKNGK